MHMKFSPFFRVSQLDNEFLEFYGSLQLCHESKKRQFFDKWKSIDDKPPSQRSLGIDPVIPEVDGKEVREFINLVVQTTQNKAQN